MKCASRRRSAAQPRTRNVGSPADDPHDAIDLQLLALWLGVSQLREALRRNTGHGRAIVGRPRIANAKAPAVKRVRRRAA